MTRTAHFEGRIIGLWLNLVGSETRHRHHGKGQDLESYHMNLWVDFAVGHYWGIYRFAKQQGTRKTYSEREAVCIYPSTFENQENLDENSSKLILQDADNWAKFRIGSVVKIIYVEPGGACYYHNFERPVWCFGGDDDQFREGWRLGILQPPRDTIFLLDRPKGNLMNDQGFID